MLFFIRHATSASSGYHIPADVFRRALDKVDEETRAKAAHRPFVSRAARAAGEVLCLPLCLKMQRLSKCHRSL